MSIELEMEGGQLRVRVDTEGQRAMSELVDPMTFIYDICETAEISCVMSEGEVTILPPEESSEEQPVEEGTDAQEDD